MAKVYIERAYIEPYDEEDSHQILIHVKEGNNHVLAGKVELTKNVSWIYTNTAENGDLEINNSAGMEDSKWDYLIKEIIGDING
jgi:hypothetical protein